MESLPTPCEHCGDTNHQPRTYNHAVLCSDCHQRAQLVQFIQWLRTDDGRSAIDRAMPHHN